MQSNLAKKGKHSIHQGICAADIVASFNTWAFKREQPDDAVLLHGCAERALQLKEPLNFVTYWGKGPRSAFSAPDASCLDFLHKMLCRISEVHEGGAGCSLLLTDTHARLNQHSPESIHRYFSDINREASSRGFNCRFLSEVVASADTGSLEVRELPPPNLQTALRESAAKWYRGAGSHDAIALEYFVGNMREKRAVEALYPSSIFISFNNSNFRLLFPDGMPIFYMYSLKRGVAVKPWFIGSDDGKDAWPGGFGDLHLLEPGKNQ